MHVAGAVWWGLVDFRDGAGERKKYFILLNEVESDGELFVCAVVTSQGTKRYAVRDTGPACGCPSAPCYRIDRGQEACFDLPTWVQFDNLILLTRADFEEFRRTGKVGFIQMLSSDRVRSVMNCATKSDDLAGRYVDLIKRSLSAMNARTASVQAAKAASKVAPKAPIEELLEQLAPHGSHCRREFCELARISEADLVALMAAPQQGKLLLEDGVAALELVCEACTCGAPRRDASTVS